MKATKDTDTGKNVEASRRKCVGSLGDKAIMVKSKSPKPSLLQKEAHTRCVRRMINKEKQPERQQPGRESLHNKFSGSKVLQALLLEGKVVPAQVLQALLKEGSAMK